MAVKEGEQLATEKRRNTFYLRSVHAKKLGEGEGELRRWERDDDDSENDGNEEEREIEREGACM